MSRNLLVVITGPTGVGKTAVAIQLAKHFKTAVVSADSRQFFREIPIGTAQPSQAEMQGVKHYFIASHSIHESLDAGTYATLAEKIISEEFKQHRVLVLCGGSGLYIDAVVNGFDKLPDADERLRKELRERFQEEGLEPLLVELKQLDPEYYEEVDRNNHARVLRALEVCHVSGMKYSQLRKGKIKENEFDVLKICIDLPREELYARIDQRVEEMMKVGLEKEARSVFQYRELNPLRTVGYKELFDHFDGKISMEEAILLIKQHSRNYAKRQLTWWRRDASVQWFSPSEVERMVHEVDVRIANV